MSNIVRAPIWRLARPWLSAVAAVALVLAALAGPAVANEGPTRLVDPSVSPRTGEPTTTITFSVTYRNRDGSKPDHVRVVIDSASRDMSPASSSTDYKSGVPFTFATKLAVGVHEISFAAMDSDRITAEASGGKVTISAPPSDSGSAGSGSGSGGSGSGSGGSGSGSGGTGSGTDGTSASGGSTSGSGSSTDGTGTSGTGTSGTSTSGSGTDGTSASGGSTSGTGTSGGSGSTDASATTGGTGSGSTNASATTGGQDAASGPTQAPGATAEPASGSDSGSGGASSPTDPTTGATGGVDDSTGVGDSRNDDTSAPGAIAGAGSIDPGTGTGTTGGSGGAGSGGPFASATGLELLGVGSSLFDRAFRALPVMVSTSAVVTAWAAFLTFGKKRRDGDPTAPDPVLAANAAAGIAPAPSSSLVPQSPYQPGLPPGVDPNEAGMPRWRRPSLLEARKNDPLRSASTAVSLTFAQGAVGPLDGKERRRIRYRLVRLMDVPDEVRANEIGILDEGDEVQLLEKSGTYWLVLCPDGRQGWLHKMVLGDIVRDDDAPVELNPDGIDDDILSAFLTTRPKTA